jgi:cytochrome b involved in lipid metabolism
MNTNKKTAVIIGVLVILVALVVVISQQSSKNAPSQTVPVNDVVATDTFTMADVATHKTQNDCWTVVNGSVYNVTSWISKHPGGAGAIASMCGVDATSAFSGQHSGEKRPANELAGFKIGTLK